jgi:hypothetical protein
VSEAWTCHARPAALGGRPCGHENRVGMQGPPLMGQRVLCCEACGCTKHASDDRQRRAEEQRKAKR